MSNISSVTNRREKRRLEGGEEPDASRRRVETRSMTLARRSSANSSASDLAGEVGSLSLTGRGVETEEQKKKLKAFCADVKAWFKDGEYEIAEGLLEQGMVWYPESIELKIFYAEVLCKSEKYDKMEDFAREMLKKNPGHAAKTMLGCALACKKRYEEAEAIFRELTQFNLEADSKAKAYQNLASVLIPLGKNKEAVEILKMLVELKPEEIKFRLHLIQILEKECKYEEAEVELRWLFNREPRRSDLPRRLSIVLGKQGKWEESAHFLRSALKLDPRVPSLQYELGLNLFRRGKDEEALVHLRLAVEMDKKNAESWNAYGACCYRQKRYLDAEAAIRAAVELMPKNSVFQNGLRRCCMRLGKYQEAKEIKESLKGNVYSLDFGVGFEVESPLRHMR